MTGRLVQQRDLTTSERRAMLGLLNEHFDGVSREQFDADLSEKNWVVLIEGDHELVGFSTLLAYPAEVAGEKLNVICSGDTIVSPVAWRSVVFTRTWIHSVYAIERAYPDSRLIWLLLTSGFRTYRLLSTFWHEFYPRPQSPTPGSWQRLLNELAAQRFGSRFCAERGIVRLVHPQTLRATLADIPAGRLADPHIAYFLERNSGHVNGDELVCIADLSPDNLTPAGRRIVYGAST